VAAGSATELGSNSMLAGAGLAKSDFSSCRSASARPMNAT
jgi:hypothetical protein